jgi:hypothetical protein
MGMGVPAGKIADKKREKNQGAAMIIALVVSVVIMAFALSLLLLSYSLFSSVSGNTIQTQCKELAKSVNSELGQELMDTGYDSYEQQYAAAGSENNLLFFLRYNLWQDGIWPYYNDEETGHSKADSYRYFKLDAINPEEYGGVADQILVTIYWEIQSDEPGEETDKSFTILHIRTEVDKGDYACAIDSAYALTVTSYDENADSDDMDSLENLEINPYNTEIDKNEKWIWTPD